jgi:hypothetical protein
MKNLLLLSLILIPSFLSAQKPKYDEKTRIVSLDGKDQFKLDRTGCGFGMVDCHYDVYDLEDKKLFRINFREFNSPVEVSSSNPKGRVTYFEFVFLASRQKAEVEEAGLKQERVAKLILANNLVRDGKLNELAVDEFILVNGTRFSERVKF